MKKYLPVYSAVLTITILLTGHAKADNRCEADQLAMAGNYCQAYINCLASFPLDPIKQENCLLKPTANFWQRYDKAQAAAANRGQRCFYQESADIARSSLSDSITTLYQDNITDWSADRVQDRWYKSLFKTLAASCNKTLGIEANFAKSNNLKNYLKASGKEQEQLQKKLATAIAKTTFAYAGPSSFQIQDSLSLLTSGTVGIIRPPRHVTAKVMLAESTYIDSDINDTNTTPVANDDFASAQVIPAPAIVGGYVNLAGTGSDGNSKVAGDANDFFKVSLAVNQVILLNIGNPNADLDLYLYDQDGVEMAKSEGVSASESVIIPNPGSASGSYFVKVAAYDNTIAIPGADPDPNASNYSLSFGQLSSSQIASRQAEFVPGQIIVRMKHQVLPAAASTHDRHIQAQQMAASYGAQALAGASDRDMLWKLSDDQSQRHASLQRMGASSKLANGAASNTSASDLKADTLRAVKALRHRADVASADLNYIRKALATPNDTYYNLQWGYPLMNLPTAWDVNKGSSNAGQPSIVAVIDTGVLLNHPDLQGQFVLRNDNSVDGYDFIADPTNSNDGDGIDSDADDPGDTPGGSSSYHGTHVAGTIAAASNFDPQLVGSGVAGVAGDARIMPLRVLGINGGTDYDIGQAVRYASGLSNDSNRLPARKADVINLSLGGPDASSLSRLAFQDARKAGVIVVAAAGNENSSLPSYPAAYNGVVSVSAIDIQKNRAPYSNFGSSVDVAAPGGDTSVDRNGDGYVDGILSTLASGEGAGISYDYQFYQGTSMATPHVAGVAALMKAVNPNLTPGDFDNLLSGGKLTDDIGASGRDNDFGYGLINAQKAVQAAGGTLPASPPTLGFNLNTLNFGPATSSITLEVFNAGSGNLNVTLVQSDQPWLTIQKTKVDTQGLGSYTVSVDRSSLTDGSYNATLTVSSDADNRTLPVWLRVGGPASDTGKSYFQLLNLLNDNDTLQLDVTPVNGEYQLNFSGVKYGDYLLLGGTDMDNDGFICSMGELCGGYPSVEQLLPISVRGDVANLAMSASFAQPFQSFASLQTKSGSKLTDTFANGHGIERRHPATATPTPAPQARNKKRIIGK